MIDDFSRGLVYIHMLLVAIMAFAGIHPILLYTFLFWGACGHFSVLLCEEEYYIEFPSFWDYRQLLGLGVIYTLSLNNMQSVI